MIKSYVDNSRVEFHYEYKDDFGDLHKASTTADRHKPDDDDNGNYYYTTIRWKKPGSFKLYYTAQKKGCDNKYTSPNYTFNVLGLKCNYTKDELGLKLRHESRVNMSKVYLGEKLFLTSGKKTLFIVFII